jgi:hypothetical protein
MGRDEFEWDVRKRPEFPGAIRAEQAGNARSFSHVSSELHDWCPVFVLISGRRAQAHLLAPATSIPFRIEMLNGDTASLVDACEKRPDVPIRPTILFSSFS